MSLDPTIKAQVARDINRLEHDFKQYQSQGSLGGRAVTTKDFKEQLAGTMNKLSLLMGKSNVAHGAMGPDEIGRLLEGLEKLDPEDLKSLHDLASRCKILQEKLDAMENPNPKQFFLSRAINKFIGRILDFKQWVFKSSSSSKEESLLSEMTHKAESEMIFDLQLDTVENKLNERGELPGKEAPSPLMQMRQAEMAREAELSENERQGRLESMQIAMKACRNQFNQAVIDPKLKEEKLEQFNHNMAECRECVEYYFDLKNNQPHYAVSNEVHNALKELQKDLQGMKHDVAASQSKTSLSHDVHTTNFMIDYLLR